MEVDSMALAGKMLSMQLNDYRGLSAYEIAVKNGFEGTEKEWLNSLRGEPGADGNLVTVNHKKSVDGNISVNGTDIQLYPGMSTPTVSGKIEEVVGELGKTKEEVIENKEEIKEVKEKAAIFTYVAGLPIASWVLEEDTKLYFQNVEMNNVTADKNKTSVIVSPPADRELEDEYLKCEVRASAQGEGVLVFTCTGMPEIDLVANVMVVILGVTAAETTDIHVEEGDGA